MCTPQLKVIMDDTIRVLNNTRTAIHVSVAFGAGDPAGGPNPNINFVAIQPAFQVTWGRVVPRVVSVFRTVLPHGAIPPPIPLAGGPVETFVAVAGPAAGGPALVINE